jgi:Protein of unknown function (DUF5131)
VVPQERERRLVIGLHCGRSHIRASVLNSRSRIGRCSRDEAIKYRSELKAMEPHRHTVAEIENPARKCWQQRGLRTPMGVGMNKTPIRWSTYTWNCWSGCERISPACRFCYAETKAERMRSTPTLPNGFELTYRPHKLQDPLKIKEPALVFVNSMADFFDERVPDEWRDRLLDIVRVTPHLQFQVLTKRPRVLVDYCDRRDVPDNVWLA